MLTLSLAYVLLLICVFSLVNLMSMRQQKNNLQTTLTALNSIEIIRKLLEDVAQSRGAANVYLNGKTDFESRLKHAQNSVREQLQQLASMVKKLDSAYYLERITDYSNDWQEIEKKVLTFTPNESFSRHTEFIQNLLFLIEDLREDFSLKRLTGENIPFLVNSTSSSLPRVAEAISQLRGIGTGAATKSVCDVSTRIKLKYLHHYAKTNIDTAFNTLPQNLMGLEVQISQFKNDATQFLNSLYTNFIENKTISLNPEQFYDQATIVISDNFKLIDKMLPIIQVQIEENQRIATHKKHIKLSLSSVAFCVSAIISWAILF